MKSQLMPGNSKNKGFSLMELMFVIGLLLMITSIGLAIGTYLKQDRTKVHRASELVATEINKVRKEAWVGAENIDNRTLNPLNLNLGSNVRFLAQMSESEIPDTPMLNPKEPLVFEAQTAKLPNNQWGALVLHDDQTNTSIALVIQPTMAPIKKYIRYAGQDQFQLVVNNVY